ncbi:hypothetical protein CE91St32_26990 [Gordonibacter pamelaeae]|nr:hypothetical protein CE91St32_26990 [Gordonibacter pamelaeae]
MPSPPGGEGSGRRIVYRHVPAGQAATRLRRITRNRRTGGVPFPFAQRADADHQRQGAGSRLPAWRESSVRLRRPGASARCAGCALNAARQLEAHDPAGMVERRRGKTYGGPRVERRAFGTLHITRGKRTAGSTGGSLRIRPRCRR